MPCCSASTPSSTSSRGPNCSADALYPSFRACATRYSLVESHCCFDCALEPGTHLHRTSHSIPSTVTTAASTAIPPMPTAKSHSSFASGIGAPDWSAVRTWSHRRNPIIDADAAISIRISPSVVLTQLVLKSGTRCRTATPAASRPSEVRIHARKVLSLARVNRSSGRVEGSSVTPP